jgi:Outer membrane protein beta-barrel domain
LKKSITLVAVVLAFALTAAATDQSQYEAYLGFQYVRANQFNQNFGLGQEIGGFSMYGGDGQFIYNFNRWLSGVGSFGAVNKPNVGIINASNTTAFTLFGPRVYYRTHGFSPFAEALFGASYRHISTQVEAITLPDTPILPVANPSTLFPGPFALVNGQLNTTQTAFTMMVGGGLDYRLSRHFSLRALEVDYVLTRFPSLTSGYRANQSSIAASAGVIFTFGSL